MQSYLVIFPILDLSTSMGSAVQGGSAGFAFLAAAPQVEGELCSQGKALTSVNDQGVCLDKYIMLK